MRIENEVQRDVLKVRQHIGSEDSGSDTTKLLCLYLCLEMTMKWIS